MGLLLVTITLTTVIWLYFRYNPLTHGSWFMFRRFVNWFPLGMSYAFLYMARYNINASQKALAMDNRSFGMIFAAGATTYALSLVFNGPIVDKIGGKRGILISTLGAAAANIVLGVLTYIWLKDKPAVNMALIFAVFYSLNMYFQSFGAVSIIKIKAYWFHVRERGMFGAIFGTLISLGVYVAFDWGQAIVDSAAVSPKHPDMLHSIFQYLFNIEAGSVAAVWLVYFIPAALLVLWGVTDFFLITDTPAEAGLEDFDTHDASSGEMDREFSIVDLLKRVFLNPIMLMIALVEFCNGVVRNGVVVWYKPFVEQVPQAQAGSAFFHDHWGLLLFLSGISGGFLGGHISDKYFQSRRGPPTAMSGALLVGFLALLAVSLFTSAVGVGISAVAISLLTISITALMSGTAAADFGGRKATATAAGVTDAFVYLGAAVQSFTMASVIKFGWIYWPLFLVPFAAGALLIAWRMWNHLPDATRRYLLTVEKVDIVVEQVEQTATLEIEEVT